MTRKNILCGGAIFFGILVLIFLFEIFFPIDSHGKKSAVFIVKKGEGSSKIAKNLEEKKLIRSAPIFRFWVVVSGLSHTLKAGAYELSPSMNTARIAEKLASGKVMREFITIPDGWTLRDIANEFERQKFFTAKEFLAYAKNLEGYVFPDTYQISRTQTLQNIVDQMTQNFDAHFTKSLREETARQKKTITQVVIMASILEKEVQTVQDKKIVAGILWKRIRNGMELQVDASPETYKNRGLPTSPISNPGMNSIVATLYPMPSPYFYYLSKKDGTTVYSITLEEHNAARAKYLSH